MTHPVLQSRSPVHSEHVELFKIPALSAGGMKHFCGKLFHQLCGSGGMSPSDVNSSEKPS